MPNISNSTNLIAAESALETLSESIEGMRETLTRAKTFRRQLRSILGVEQGASVVDTVRNLKADLDAANAAAAARPSGDVVAKLERMNTFRKDLRALLDVPRNGSVTVKVRELLAENAALREKQAALAEAIQGVTRLRAA